MRTERMTRMFPTRVNTIMVPKVRIVITASLHKSLVLLLLLLLLLSLLLLLPLLLPYRDSYLYTKQQWSLVSHCQVCQLKHQVNLPSHPGTMRWSLKISFI